MKSFEDTSEEEAPKHSQTYTSLPLKLTAKDILATKTQNYFAQAKRTENVLIQIAFSIGLGSIWRFPYLCHWNGGGEFILLYSFMLLLFGIPLLYMEMILGQWLHLDSIRIWKQLTPWLGGLGYTSIMVCILISVYNSIIMSWTLSYLGNSFYYPLPWNQCSMVKNTNATGLPCLRTVPHQYFWYHTTLNASANIEEGGEQLALNLTLGTFIAWFFLFIIITTRLKSSVPMLSLSIFLPYVTLLCLLIRCLFLEGAVTSLRRMVVTELSDWASLDLWRHAGGHVLYSLGLGLGTIINISSHRARDNNYIQVALLVAVVNLVISLLVTSIIFIVLGFWATTSGQACVEKGVQKVMNLIDKGVLPQNYSPPKNILLLPPLDYLNWIENLPQHFKYQVMLFSPSCSIEAQDEKFMQGPGLAFVAFSQAVSLLPCASFWAIVFFLTLLITELSTLIKIVESIVFPLQNSISITRNHPILLPVVVCLGGFLGSLVFASYSGSYIMSFFDDHLVPLTLFIVVAFKNVTLAWVYGVNRFREEMYGELGLLMSSSFTFLWCYVTLPGLLTLIVIYLIQLYHKEPPNYIAWNSSSSQEVEQPYLQSTLGWVTFLSIITFLPIPIYPLHQWWYLQDHIVNDPFKKLSKKTPLVPTKPSEWPKYHLAKPNFLSQERKSENSAKSSSSPLVKMSNPASMWSQHSQSSLGFSLSFISSLTSAFSIRSLTLPVSRQVSPASTTINSDIQEETKGENLHKSDQ